MTDPLADAIREAMFRMPVVTSAGIADAVRAYTAGVIDIEQSRWAGRGSDDTAAHRKEVFRYLRFALLDQSSAGELPQAARGCGADAGKSSDAREGAAGSPPAPRPLTPDQTVSSGPQASAGHHSP